MIFRSNLIAPDLRPHFKLKIQPRGHSFGHDCLSDPDFEPDCTYWTDDEAAILYTVAFIMGGNWLDIGCRFGWTSAHIAAAGASVICIDPHLKYQVRQDRFETNLSQWWNDSIYGVCHDTADAFFRFEAAAGPSILHDGFVIDGCHDAPEPLNDAQGCVKLAKPNCVIMLHDFYGQPVQDAVTWLIEQGWHARIYWTPNGVACCWRDPKQGFAMVRSGWFTPPEHHGDPRIYREMQGRFPNFDLGACE